MGWANLFNHIQVQARFEPSKAQDLAAALLHVRGVQESAVAASGKNSSSPCHPWWSPQALPVFRATTHALGMRELQDLFEYEGKAFEMPDAIALLALSGDPV